MNKKISRKKLAKLYKTINNSFQQLGTNYLLLKAKNEYLEERLTIIQDSFDYKNNP